MKTPAILLSALLLLAFPASFAADPLPDPPPGWKIEVVATAPDIKHPSVVCAAPDGRVFVAEDPMDISAPAHASQGRIVCFHPDGRRSIFADNLYAIFGLQYLDGKIYVLHNPKFSVFADAGDRAGVREDLIESTNPNPWALEWNDHVPANFQLAMDGFFYISVGDKGLYGAVGRDGKRVDLHGGGIVRIRPDGTDLEIFSSGTRNTLDVAMNEEDEIFTYDNTDEKQWMGRVTHMVDGGFYGYPYDFIPQRSYTLWMMADYGAGAATGTFAYNEDALPQEYHGNLFLADFGKKQVLRVKIARTAGTYDDVSHQEIFSNVPPLFRPVGICPSTDGLSIYICDWQHLDVKESVTVGRLHKLTYTGPSLAAAKPRWFIPAAQRGKFNATAAELIDALSHPARSVRMVAQRRLAHPENSGALRALLRDPSAPPRAKWHALWACDAIDSGQAARAEILALSRAGELSVRRQAIRQLGTRKVAAGREPLEQALGEPDPSLRLAAATALGRIASSASIPTLQGALVETNLFPRYAVFTALRRIGQADNAAWQPIARGLAHSAPAIREGTFFALREVYDASLARELVEQTKNKSSSHARKLALELLALIHHQTPAWKGEWWAYHPVNLPPPARNIPWAGTALLRDALPAALRDPVKDVQVAALAATRALGDPMLGAEVRQLFSSSSDNQIKGAALETLAQIKDLEAIPLIKRVLESSDASLLPAAMRAANQLPTPEYSAELQRILTRTNSSPEFILPALELASALKLKSLAPGLEQYTTHKDEPVRKMAVAALLASDQDRALRHFDSLLSSDVPVRKTVIQALATVSHPNKIRLLRRAAADRETRPEALTALAQQPALELLDLYLEALAETSAFVRESTRKALKELAAPAWPSIKAALPKLKPTVTAELRHVYRDHPEMLSHIRAVAIAPEPADYLAFALANDGDAQKGSSMFRDEKGLACIKCHQVGGQGAQLGPDLTTVGAQFSPQELAESILFPSKSVREGYESYLVEMKDGESYSGLFKGETTGEVHLLDAQGNLHRLKLADIQARRKSELSLMPEGLHTALELQDFADLLAYLRSLKPAN